MRSRVLYGFWVLIIILALAACSNSTNQSPISSNKPLSAAQSSVSNKPLSASASSSSPAAAASGIKGDANGDGSVDMGDVIKVERIILGLDKPTPGADVNGDGSVNMADLVAVEQIMLAQK